MTESVVINQVGQASVDIVLVVSATIEVSSSQQSSVEISAPNQPSVEVGMTSIGIRGPKGDQGEQGEPGPNSIGGFGFVIDSPQNGDLLQLSGSAWRNVNQVKITDGGNF